MKRIILIVPMAFLSLILNAQPTANEVLAQLQYGIETSVAYSIQAIDYLAGEYEDYQNDTLSEKTCEGDDKEFEASGDEKAFKVLAVKSAKVFIDAEDKGVLAHATNSLDYWSFWQIVKTKEEADFIFEVKFRYGNLGKSFAYAIIRTPDGKEVYRSHEATNIGKADFNSKRASVTQLIDLYIKPTFD